MKVIEKTERVYSVAGFCKAYGISRSTFYNLPQRPEILKVRGRVLITLESARAWEKLVAA